MISHHNLIILENIQACSLFIHGCVINATAAGTHTGQKVTHSEARQSSSGERHHHRERRKNSGFIF